jgi:hypothetical protein
MSDKATELHGLGPVDHTHPAAEPLQDAVVRDSLANQAEKPLWAMNLRLRPQASQRADVPSARINVSTKL